VTYTRWATGEPSTSPSYNYAYLSGSNGQWYDDYNTYTHYGIIELDGAAAGPLGPGPEAQYLLDVDIADLVPPVITEVSLCRLKAALPME